MDHAELPKPRRGLSADALIETLRRRFSDVPDNRRKASCSYTMSDTLMVTVHGSNGIFCQAGGEFFVDRDLMCHGSRRCEWHDQENS